MLKPGIPLLAWLVLLAIVIEARDSQPRSLSTGLTSLGIEASSKGIVTSKHSTITLQVILGYPAFIHPQTEALISDELNDANGFIESSTLCLVSIHLVLVDQHACSFPCRRRI